MCIRDRDLSGSELNRRSLAPIGRFVREALAARVTAQALERGELTYLRPVARFPGFPRALTATFEELRLNAIDPARLQSCGESGPDLARLLADYTRELAERRFADHATRVLLARDGLSASYNTLRQTAVVTLDLVPRSSLERELLASVIGAARTGLSLPIAAEIASPATSLESLQRYLFAGDAVPAHEDDGSVVILSTSGEALECVEIARAIHAATAEGVPFDRIAILLRSPERHQPLILEALRRAGIPVSCTLGARRPDAAGRRRWLAEVSAWRQEWEREVAPGRSSQARPIRPERVLAELRAALPADGILLSDVGAHHNWIVQEWLPGGPGTLVQSWGFASMGFGMAGALGARLAAPDRPVAAVVGDGCFLMLPSVVATAVQYDLPCLLYTSRCV